MIKHTKHFWIIAVLLLALGWSSCFSKELAAQLHRTIEALPLLENSEATVKKSIPLRIRNALPLEVNHWYRLNLELRAASKGATQAGQAGAQLTMGSFHPGKEIPREQIELQTIGVVADEWQSFRYDFRAKRSYSPGEFCVEISPRYFKEAIEVRGLDLTDNGLTRPKPLEKRNTAYPGQDSDAPWRKEASERIRQHRMAPLSISIVDEWGNPVEGATIEVRMTRHAYLFGTCAKAVRIVDAEIRKTPPDYNRESWLADNIIYRQKLKELFNFIVLENDLKWPSWAGQSNNRSQQVTMDALRWLREEDFTAKGHTLMWGSWRQSPDFLQDKQHDPEALKATITSHIHDQGHAMRDWVEYADVLNEAMSHNDLIEAVGWPRVPAWFKFAKAAMPEVKLVLNEFDILGNGGIPKRQDDHANFISSLLDAGAPVDVLGFQSHFWSTRFTEPEKLYAIIDRFSRFGLPMMVSEFDMNILDEDLQADYTRDFLTVWFSHPATEAFLMWGFWAKAHWFGEPGAMFRDDWSPKPNLKAYTDLVFDEWWTNEVLQSGPQGFAACRGFLGQYAITVTAAGRQTAVRRITLSDKGLNLPIVLYPAKNTQP